VNTCIGPILREPVRLLLCSYQLLYRLQIDDEAVRRSFGIAIIINIYNPIYAVVDLISNLEVAILKFESCFTKKGLMTKKGFTVNHKKAYQAIDYSVLKQSTVLAYMDIFLYLESYFIVYSIVFSSNEDKIKLTHDAMHYYKDKKRPFSNESGALFMVLITIICWKALKNAQKTPTTFFT
jgi:hypothetical protein